MYKKDILVALVELDKDSQRYFTFKTPIDDSKFYYEIPIIENDPEQNYRKVMTKYLKDQFGLNARSSNKYVCTFEEEYLGIPCKFTVSIYTLLDRDYKIENEIELIYNPLEEGFFENHPFEKIYKKIFDVAHKEFGNYFKTVVPSALKEKKKKIREDKKINENKKENDPISEMVRLVAIADDCNLNEPFPQANDFEKILKILEIDNEGNLQSNEFLLEYLDVSTVRQIDYYLSACRFLNIIGDRRNFTSYAIRLKTLMKIERNFCIFITITNSPVFKETWDYLINNREMMDSESIAKLIMEKYNITSEEVANRRASTVKQWISWCIDIRNDYAFEHTMIEILK